MHDYTFGSLSPREFEVLTRDLLQAEHGIRLETFKAGPDEGIDLRGPAPGGGELIVQCKHYVGSGFESLVRQLKNDERPKVERLQPARYILATSVALSPGQKERVLKALTPYLRGPEDILGQGDLNNLLSQHQQVELAHAKLWMSSVAVMRRVLHGGVANRSNFAMRTAYRRAQYYVHTRAHQQAREILASRPLCVIAGNPGLGKTTLAQMLALEYAKDGFEFVQLSEDATDALTAFVRGAKQFFLMDDFLGSTSLRDARPVDLLHLLEGLEQDAPESKLVLTTRTYVMNQAREANEALAYSDLLRRENIVTLSELTFAERMEIVYNHSLRLDNKRRRAVARKAACRAILSHPNFNPRIVDAMTAGAGAEAYKEPGPFIEAFLANLADPRSVWEIAYRSGIGEDCRDILRVLTMLPEEVSERVLFEAYAAFAGRGGRAVDRVRLEDQFENALPTLEDSFTVKLPGRKQVAFHNPSVRDFMLGELARHPEAVRALCETAIYFDGLTQLWGYHGREEDAPPTRRVLRQQWTSLLSALRRTLDSPRPFAGGDLTILDRQERALMLLGILEDAEDDDAAELARWAYAQLEGIGEAERMPGRTVDFLRLGFVLVEVASLRRSWGGAREAFLFDRVARAVELMPLMTRHPREYEGIAGLLNAHPDLATGRQREQLREGFERSARDVLQYYAMKDSWTELGISGSSFLAVSETLGADLGPAGERLREEVGQSGAATWQTQPVTAQDWQLPPVDDDELDPEFARLLYDPPSSGAERPGRMR